MVTTTGSALSLTPAEITSKTTLWLGPAIKVWASWERADPVSYTHLTLPTISCV